MRVLVALWSKEWLALSRDMHGLAVLFVMPAAFIVIMSLALSDVFRDGSTRQVDFAVIGADGTQLANDLAGDGFKLAPSPASEEAARAAVRKGSPALVLVVPSGFGADPAVKLKVLADPTLPPAQIATFLARLQGAALGVKASAPPLDLEVVGNPRGGKPSSVQQNVPAWLIFGMFCVVMPESMQTWASLSPMAWALDGFHAVILRQGSAADIVLPCLKLLVLAAALLAAAFWLHRRRRA